MGLAIPRPIEEGLTMPNFNPVRRSIQDALLNVALNPELTGVVGRERGWLASRLPH